MKRIRFIFIILCMLLLSGCSLLGINDVEAITGWSFQYNEGINEYSLFFGFEDSSGNATSSYAKVDIRIEDEKGNVLYEDSKSVSVNDFGYYTSQARGEQYLAEIRIPESEISEGESEDGTVYLKVYNDSSFEFDEVNCAALYCLPVKDIVITGKDLPCEVNLYGYDNELESTIVIDSISFKYDKSLSWADISITGMKTYNSSSFGYDSIQYKIYDSDDFVVSSGTIMLSGIGEGDKFKDDSIKFTDAVPGENYTIAFFDR